MYTNVESVMLMFMFRLGINAKVIRQQDKITAAVKKTKQHMQISPFLSLCLKMMEDADEVLLSVTEY